MEWLEWETLVAPVLMEYIGQMMMAGYNEPYRKVTLEHALAIFDKMKQRELEGKNRWTDRRTGKSWFWFVALLTKTITFISSPVIICLLPVYCKGQEAKHLCLQKENKCNKNFSCFSCVMQSWVINEGLKNPPPPECHNYVVVNLSIFLVFLLLFFAWITVEVNII